MNPSSNLSVEDRKPIKAQANTLVGKTDYASDLDEFVYGQRSMQLSYNHVPIYAVGVEQGIGHSIAAPIADGVTQHYVHHADLSGNALLQNSQLLHAVALLIDTTTGRVVNAAKSHVLPCDPAGMAAATARPVQPARFSLSGVRLQQPRRGISIERLPDGSVRKVFRP